MGKLLIFPYSAHQIVKTNPLNTYKPVCNEILAFAGNSTLAFSWVFSSRAQYDSLILPESMIIESQIFLSCCPRGAGGGNAIPK